ncbi:hypothetical protein TELCIR_08705 [Teladorsagia circumcincta]|uniref:Uncharacterized protein n=1 Tax=Teladorsagia circumcincta TaxID=45464 RepID=A0A2G9UH12_TELCI|nr:hypothetical protein TELCIR_08705 [Teladorsagia circumcincta]
MASAEDSNDSQALNTRARVSYHFWRYFMSEGRKKLATYNKDREVKIAILKEQVLRKSDETNMGRPGSVISSFGSEPLPNILFSYHYFNNKQYLTRYGDQDVPLSCLDHASGHIRNDTIRERFGVAPIADKMREARLRWYGHVLRGNDDSVRKRL